MRSFYENQMYGKWCDGESVSFQHLPKPDKLPEPKPGFFFPTDFEDADKIRICVSESNGRSGSFDANFFLPKPENRFLSNGKCPILICLHPIFCKEYALNHGYALVFLNPNQIASDDIAHNGAFYQVHPYAEEQTGVLMAWAWGASKVLDALEAGLAAEYNIDTDAAILTGVSRYGKATAVAAAFEPRFRMFAPACSGAGGLALYSVVSEGKTYDLTKVGGPSEYTYSKNEPLSCLQSDAERGWFVDRFLDFKSPEDIPYDQENLVTLALSKDRYYFVIAACMSEDWVNAPAMWECYKRALPVFDAAGLYNHLVCHFHKEGHAVLEEDLAAMLPYFNKMHYGIDENVDFAALHTCVFSGQE